MDITKVYEEHVRPLPLADRLRLAERIVAQAAEATEAEADAAAEPTPPRETLGQRLRAMRARIELAGEPLLDEEALQKELADRRGGAAAWGRGRACGRSLTPVS